MIDSRQLTATLPKSKVHSRRLPRLRNGKIFCASFASLRSCDDACVCFRRAPSVMKRRSRDNISGSRREATGTCSRRRKSFDICAGTMRRNLHTTCVRWACVWAHAPRVLLLFALFCNTTTCASWLGSQTVASLNKGTYNGLAPHFAGHFLWQSVARLCRGPWARASAPRRAPKGRWGKQTQKATTTCLIPSLVAEPCNQIRKCSCPTPRSAAH